MLQRLALVFFSVFVVAVVVVVTNVPKVDAQSAPYSQEVDNTTEGRFKAGGGWGTSSYGKGVYDENYRFARPSTVSPPAMFRVKIPTTEDYAVYARWPEVKGLSASAPVGVVTTSGVEWTRVNQQQNGGRWVRVGVYRMRAGDDYSIMFSRRTSGSDYVGADAVKVEKVSSVTDSSEPPEDEDSTGSTGEDVVREAKGWNRVPYRLGGTSRSGVDCSGLTMRVYEKFGVSLPRDVEKQYDYGSLVSGPPKAGDLVFFDEHGDGISHVGIATGKGTIIHASDHWKRVIETRIEYIEGYVGAKRLL